MNEELKKSIEQAQIHWLTQRLEECEEYLEEYKELEERYKKLKNRYDEFENDYLKTLAEFRGTLEKIVQVRDTLDEHTYADVIKKLDEILEE